MPPLPAGLRLGPYEVLSHLGTGAMGDVHRARDTRLDRVVAIKVLRADVAADPARRERFEREARTIAALNHPHICVLHDVGRQDEVSFLVMECLEGQTLEASLRLGPPSADTVLAYARQIAEALVAAHAKGIVHRDLKPANLFVTRDGRIKVLDFGIAKVLATSTAAENETIEGQSLYGQFIGTVGYAAPEQLRGEAIDTRTDLFALGAVLHELLTGRRLFKRRTEAEAIGAILHEETPALASAVPEPLATAVMRCLEKHPANRFQSAGEFLRALDATNTTSSVSVPTSASPSVAVLPFADLSQEKDQEYFCEGMADELITSLMSLEGVRVAPRMSALQFKQLAVDVGEIGRRLKVRTVLEGSVRRSGSMLRVTVHLTDVAEGFQVWSERYDRPLDDVFAVQEEIARAIVDKLQVEMGEQTAARFGVRKRRNIAAYNLLLQGRYYVRKLTQDAFEQGMAYFRRAIELEPDYAEAHAALAQGYVMTAMFSVAPPRLVMPIATEAVTRALSINPNLAEGQLALAWVRHWYDWDWTGAAAAYRRALELAPGDAWVRYCHSYFLACRGRFDEAVAEAKNAVDLDPVSPVIGRGIVDMLNFARRFDEAIESATRLIALEPAFASSYWALGAALAGQGRYAEAVAAIERGRPHAYGDAMLEGHLGWAHGLVGHVEEAREIARQLEARRETGYVAAWCIAIVQLGLGDLDAAMRWYRLDYSERAASCATYATAVTADLARPDPRFRELIELIEAGGPEATRWADQE